MAIACMAGAGIYIAGTLLESYSLRGGPFYEKSALGTAGRIMQFAPTAVFAGIVTGVAGVAVVLPFAAVPLVEYFQKTVVLSGVEGYIDVMTKFINLLAGSLLIIVACAAVFETESVMALAAGFLAGLCALLEADSWQRRWAASGSLRDIVQGLIHTLEQTRNALPQTTPFRPFQGEGHSLV